MSRQISFFQSENDTTQFIHEIENCGGKILIDGASIAPSSTIHTILKQMQTLPSSFRIIPTQFECTCADELFRTIEFQICCRYNNLSRTYDVGRLYIVRNDEGYYCEEAEHLYGKLIKYIKKLYHYDKKTLNYFAPDFWEKYCTHYYYAVRGNQPVYALI